MTDGLVQGTSYRKYIIIVVVVVVVVVSSGFENIFRVWAQLLLFYSGRCAPPA